jgi:site-specific DNA-methyltransferase (adenine-specific)
MNRLYFGDNLKMLRDHVANESVDLIYLDPPFNSNATYNVLFAEKSGEKSTAQITAFDDTWHWGQESEATFQELVTGPHVKLASLIDALRGFLGTNDMMAYLTMMAIRLVELRRVLKPTGSIYLHCDPTASHYLKLVMDAVFGPRMFLNEIVWKRTTAHNDPHRYGRIGDRLLFYAAGTKPTFNHVGGSYSPEQLSRFKYEDERGRYKAENLTAPHFSPTRTVEWRGVHPGRDRQWRFSPEELDRLYSEGRILLQRDGRPRKDGLKEYLEDSQGPHLQDVWTDIALPPTSGERLGYQTQKPEALLERIIRTSSNGDDLVLDPFCGCGTAIAVAERLGRRWIGIDVTHLAISILRNRLQTAFGAALSPFEVVGSPTDLESAAALAAIGRYQFEYWALALIDAWPAHDMKKGADSGIDGFISFFDDASGKAKRVIIQVKSGHVGVAHVRDLKGTLGREKAAIGVLITLEEPTKPMKTEAVAAGFYDSEHFKGEYPRMQILTIRELLDGAKVRFPQAGLGATFKSAPKKHRGEQQELF